jgi:hypothetical protein
MARPLTLKERDLVVFILGQSSPLHGHLNLVEEMNDGGMGSLRFVGSANRRLGACVGEAEFDDADGVTVSVALNIDQRGELLSSMFGKWIFRHYNGLRPSANFDPQRGVGTKPRTEPRLKAC